MIPNTRLYYDRTGTIELFGDIGPDGITAEDFDAALYKLRRCEAITLLIDSSGGALEHSGYIARALRRLPMQRDALVVGRCHSAAVDVLMACGHRRALIGSTLMLHRCNSLDAEIADADAETATATYAPRLWQRTDWRGATRAQIEKWIDVGTWFSSAEMKFYAFVDQLIEPSDTVPLRTFFDLTGRNRPLPSPPYVEYGTVVECPMYDAHYRSLSASRPARQPIDVPPLPARLAGKIALSASHLADIRAAATRSSDPRAAANAELLAEGIRRLRDEESQRWQRAMASR